MHGDHDFKENSIPVHTFSLKHLSSLNFKMLNEEVIVPGSVHLPLFCYFNEFPGDDNYWVIEYDVEYDVEYGGNWEHLFNTYLASDADFVSGYITSFENEKHWPWWKLDHPSKEISLEKRIRSFHPIYRISNKAIRFLKNELSAGWTGHSEVLLSTLLHHHDFQLLDFGKRGEFSNAGYSDFSLGNDAIPAGDEESRLSKIALPSRKKGVGFNKIRRVQVYTEGVWKEDKKLMDSR